MYKEKILKCPLYPVWVCYIASDSEEEINKRRKLDIEDFGIGYAIRQGIQLRGEKEKVICVFIIINPNFKVKELYLSPGVIAHECLHGSSFILEYVGIHASHVNDEPQAYLIEYLIEEAHKFYKPYM